MAADTADGHGEGQRDGVAGAPFASECQIPAIKRDRHRLPVDRDGDIFERTGLGLRVEIGRHRRAGCPAGDADLEREREALLVRGHLDTHITVPRVVGRLDQGDGAGGCFERGPAGDEEVDVDRRVALRVGERADLRDEAHDVHGTAGAAEPFGTGIAAAAGQRVGIEELIAADRDAGEKAVVDHALQDIDILGVAVQQEHALVPEGVGDGGASFQVGRFIRQFEVVAERFAVTARADAACEVHFFCDDIFPKRVDGGHQRAVAGQCGDIRHAGVEIARADRVADGFRLLDDGDVVLAVGTKDLSAQVAAAAHVDEELCEAEVARVACGAVELAQADLDLLMAGYALELVGGRAEGLVDQIGAFAGHIEQRAFAGDGEVGCRRLVQMADVVKFMAGCQIAPAFFAGHAVREAQRACGVEISVGFLSGGHLGDQAV